MVGPSVREDSRRAVAPAECRLAAAKRKLRAAEAEWDVFKVVQLHREIERLEVEVLIEGIYTDDEEGDVSAEI